MVPVIVGKDDFVNGGKIDLQFFQVQSDGIPMGAGINENLMAIRFNQCGKTPFADTCGLAHEHGGENSDFEGVDLGGGIGGCSVSRGFPPFAQTAKDGPAQSQNREGAKSGGQTSEDFHDEDSVARPVQTQPKHFGLSAIWRSRPMQACRANQWLSE